MEGLWSLFQNVECQNLISGFHIWSQHLYFAPSLGRQHHLWRLSSTKSLTSSRSSSASKWSEAWKSILPIVLQLVPLPGKSEWRGLQILLLSRGLLLFSLSWSTPGSWPKYLSMWESVIERSSPLEEILFVFWWLYHTLINSQQPSSLLLTPFQNPTPS